ncbi:MAG: histidine kinase [Flavobacteriales bacterium]|nr:histidine kinase [Flavobacteriales bacterium]
MRRNTVTAINELPDGTIMVGTPGGLQSWDGYQLRDFTIDEYIYELFYTSDSTYLYALSQRAIHRLDNSGKELTSFEFPTSFFSNYAGEENDSLIIFGADLHWIIAPDLSGGRMIESPYHSPYSRGSNSLKLYENLQGDSLFINGQFLTQTSYAFELSISEQEKIVVANQGVYQLEMDSLQNIRVSWPKTRLETAFVDRRGNLWIGTVSNGLWMIHRNAMHLDFYPSSSDDEINPAWSIFEGKSVVFCTTSNGIRSFGKSNHPIISATQGMNCISGIETDQTFLVGTYRNGILRWNGRGLDVVFYDLVESIGNTVTCFQESIDGQAIWGFTKTSVVLFDPQGNYVSHTSLEEAGFTGYVMHITPYLDGYIASTTTEVVFLDSVLNVTEVLNHEETMVFSSSVHYNESTWFSSLQGGLFKLQGQELESLSSPDIDLLGLDVVGQDLFILGTRSTYLKRGDDILKIDHSDGLPQREFNQGGWYVDQADHLHVAGVEGFARFKLSDILSEATSLPKMHIDVANAVEFATEKAWIAAQQKQAKIKVSCVYPEKGNRFTFWVEAGDSLKQVIHGEELLIQVDEQIDIKTWVKDEYSQQIHAASDSNYLNIECITPITQRWWFLLIILTSTVLFVLLAFALARNRRQRKLIRKQQEDKKVADERIRISRELHDNIGARLSHIISSIDLEMYRDQGQKTKLSPINSFARETMGQLRETIWAVGERRIHFSEFQARVERYVEQSQAAFSGEIKIQSADIPDIELSPAQTINYFRIIQEAINNAIKYAQAEQITISFLLHPSSIEITVVDDGIGFGEAKMKRGSGLKGMAQRASEVHSSFQILKRQSGGGISLSIPFNE